MWGLGGLPFTSGRSWYLLFTSLPLMLLTCVGSTESVKRLWDRLANRQWVRAAAPVVAGGMLIFCIAYLVDAGYNPFLYFRF